MTPETKQICRMLVQVLSPHDLLDLASTLILTVEINPSMRDQLSERAKASLVQVVEALSKVDGGRVRSMDIISPCEGEPAGVAGSRFTKH